MKAYERFLVTSNNKTAFDVQVVLANLDFAVYSVSKYICTFLGEGAATCRLV